MEYLISQNEITRRKKAYATLSISLIVGLILASLIFKFPVSVGGYLIVASVIFLIGAFSFRFFHNLSRTKINLSDKFLEKITSGIPEKYSLDKINRVKIKWTTNKTIREIYIWLNDNKNVTITALDDFEEFRKDLLNRLDKSAHVEEVHEPLDFDHPLFYSILGLPISVFGVLIFKYLLFIDYKYVKIGAIVFSIYLFLLGIYFIGTKPISKRSGNKTVASDYIMGILMICLAAIIVFLIFNSSFFNFFQNTTF